MKIARNSGKSYIDRKNNVHEEKSVKPYIHNCRYKCNQTVNEERRINVFNEFWELQSWELQTAYLNGVIKLHPVTRKKTNAVYSKNMSCVYTLSGHRVCKDFFLKTLDISNKRVQVLVTKMNTSTSGVPKKDKRGKRSPGNKISQEKIDIIMEHINKFPRYVSHYSRHKNPECKYLDPGLTVTKMYQLYREFCTTEKKINPEKESFYRHIFNTKFNLRFHRPLTDTCAVCDKLQITIDHGEEGAKRQATFDKELHLRKAETAKLAKDSFKTLNDDSQVAICFDLQKMLPTPCVHTSKAYYLRQLWTYNFCIHNIATGSAYMFTWHEGQASRGCQEISSCLFKFIKGLPPHVTHITAFSDNCGGQNKSKIIVQFWLYIISTTNIKTVDHRFLITGHSFNECDKNFGLIEMKKKRTDRDFYVPSDWRQLISRTSQKFIVVDMKEEDFVNLDVLQTYFKNTVPGIRSMHWLRFDKNHPDTLFFKKNVAGGLTQFETYSMKLVRRGRGRPAILPDLPVETKVSFIKEAKFKNLIELLQFVPPVYHQFYRNLPHGQTEGRNLGAGNTEGVDPNELDILYDTDD